MNEAGTKARQQIVDNIKKATNILIAVSQNPSVDDLSAALGLSAMLNKVDKHATAIFSGEIPPAISFLKPDKVFENTADSLRDFIIALDKEKADHLRYKIEGDYVKIFITPYRTNISNEDLEFSQGDFNVELVLALGVGSKEQLDAALASMGQAIDNITVAAITCGKQTSQLGSIDWHDDVASSLSEMIVSLNDNLKTDKTLLDKQISTALLTGIVSSTDRFSNEKTSSRTMTTAAQLMAAGADQQLIATKLRESHAISALPNGALDTTAKAPSDKLDADVSNLPIEHDEPEQKSVPVPEAEPAEPISEEISSPISTLPPVEPEELKKPTETVNEEPSLGGTLNATTEQAEEDNKRELEDEKNKTILSHSYLDGSDHNKQAAINGAAQAIGESNTDIFSTGGIAPVASTLPPKVELPLPPPVPDFSTLEKDTVEGDPVINPIDTVPPVDVEPTSASEVISTLPPVQPGMFAPSEPVAATPAPTVADPSQFVIPGSK